MELPQNLKYTESHEWVKNDDNDTLSVGITFHAQKLLGDVVFLELPEVGRKVSAGESIAIIESVKAASDIYAPVDGEVVETNAELVDAPEEVNNDPYGSWMFRLRPADAKQLDSLLDAAGYAKSAGIE
ncbi:MAG: glycine cleavage system protein GcvH [Rhodocyclaceae bacterium]|nr:glycine cleavage system protein GcvH [Rhodocyclaceae bacterium]MBX3670315.1 glycine cleavage system protein GcvH [Rhodocyclaceae bacterium]